jgi:NAD(P)-dependent dehydrogenase (short-subunit alcohol dehydrogenase family)
MKLGGKPAVVFAAIGAIGSAVSRRLAADGARIFVSGRRGDESERLARDIGAGWAVVDATDETPVEGWLGDLAKQAEGLETLALMARARGTTPGEAGARTTSTVLGPPVRLDEAAAAVAWLASDAASGVAGQVVYVCAGALVS